MVVQVRHVATFWASVGCGIMQGGCSPRWDTWSTKRLKTYHVGRGFLARAAPQRAGDTTCQAIRALSTLWRVRGLKMRWWSSPDFSSYPQEKTGWLTVPVGVWLMIRLRDSAAHLALGMQLLDLSHTRVRALTLSCARQPPSRRTDTCQDGW